MHPASEAVMSQMFDAPGQFLIAFSAVVMKLPLFSSQDAS